MIRVVLWTLFTSQLQALAAGLRNEEGITLVVPADAEAACAALQEADAALLMGASPGYSAALAQAVRAAPRLRWLQLISTGQEGVEAHGVPPHLTVTGVGETAAPVVAEHALALLLAVARRIGDAAVQGARAEWSHAHAADITSLEGRTLCLAGYGRIGREIARRAQAFGMECIAVNRSGRNDAPDLARTVYPLARLHEALAQSDAVAISLPDAPGIRGVFDAAAWRACRPGSLVVNVGRGTVVDSDSLAAALAEGHIAGAGLDVTDPEPLPPQHALWRAPGALITPHVGGAGSAAGMARLLELLRDNLRRFRTGEPLRHGVTVGA